MSDISYYVPDKHGPNHVVAIATTDWHENLSDMLVALAKIAKENHVNSTNYLATDISADNGSDMFDDTPKWIGTLIWAELP